MLGAGGASAAPAMAAGGQGATVQAGAGAPH